jgi:alpha-N-acetylgalactosaminidase
MLAALLAGSLALVNGLALTPPMGWMTWEQYHCETDCAAHPTTCISESLIVAMIDHLSKDGWLDAGYEYVNIDDCWSGFGRDANGELYPEPIRFPHGIQWLADYAHSKGVKLGIYADIGFQTCGGYTGSKGYHLKDAKTFAKWGIDMLKLDGCNCERVDMADVHPAMSHFLNSTGRPILFSVEWPLYDSEADYSLFPTYFNMWRNYHDIASRWSSVRDVIDKWFNEVGWATFAGPGHWNDPDQLMIGMTPNEWVDGLTPAESRTQFALWAILAAPLVMSNDLRNVTDWGKQILINKEVIAVSQDLGGLQGYRLTPFGNDATVWIRNLISGDFAVALFNRGEAPIDITVKFSAFTQITSFKVRDLYNHADLGAYSGSFTATDVPAHDTVIVRLTPAS